MFQTDKTKDAVFFEDINGSSRARPRIFVINSAASTRGTSRSSWETRAGGIRARRHHSER
jgi:hypothetical protein